MWTLPMILRDLSLCTTSDKVNIRQKLFKILSLFPHFAPAHVHTFWWRFIFEVTPFRKFPKCVREKSLQFDWLRWFPNRRRSWLTRHCQPLETTLKHFKLFSNWIAWIFFSGVPMITRGIPGKTVWFSPFFEVLIDNLNDGTAQIRSFIWRQSLWKILVSSCWMTASVWIFWNMCSCIVNLWILTEQI